MKTQKCNCLICRVAWTRNDRGSLGLLIPCAILLLILGVGSFAADVVHNTLVRAELQNASDAGALAGAAALVSAQTAPMADYYATQATAANFADGNPVSENSANTTVAVSIDTNVPGEIGECHVQVSRQIQNWLASIFGRSTELVSADATAACSQNVVSTGSQH